MHILIISTLVWLSFRTTARSPIRGHFLPALTLKLLAGIALGIIYFNYYQSGDTLVFHQAAYDLVRLYNHSRADFVQFLIHGPGEVLAENQPVLKEPRSAFFIKIISLFYLFTARNYWITSIYLSLLSFSGSWMLAHALIKYDDKRKTSSLIILMYMPTFLFWTSGIIKESVSWFSLAMLSSYFLIYIKNRRIILWQIIASVFLFLILWNIKYYYAAVFILCLIPLVLYYSFKQHFKKAWRLYFSLILLSIAIGFLLVLSHPNFYPGRIWEVISENHEAVIQHSDPGHSIKFIDMENPYLQFFINIPVSLFGGLFMPLVWQGTNVFAIGTGIINTLIFIFFLGKVITIFRSGHWNASVLAFFVCVYIILLAVLLAYSTPNFGTLERYKTSFIAFFGIWVFTDNPFLKSIFRYLKH
jgi:hypothetical protein